MAKKVQSRIKLQISAGMANPSPPVGPALGQYGVNIIEFCKKFNNRSNTFEKGIVIPVIITVYSDRSFSFIMKSPPASVLLKRVLGIKQGSSKPNSEKVGTITRDQIREIVEIKLNDMTGSNKEAMSLSIIGTAHSMGIIVED